MKFNALDNTFKIRRFRWTWLFVPLACFCELMIYNRKPISRALELRGIVIRPLSSTADSSSPVRRSLPGQRSAWEQSLFKFRWIDYAPTHFDPARGVIPSQDSIKKDLLVLRRAGFTGVITYGMNVSVTAPAKALGLHVIVGIWDPLNRPEVEKAESAARNHLFVIGTIVGNEGLGTRYSYASLSQVMAKVARVTGKPVSTSEQIEKYDSKLCSLGQWLCPTVHPYWHGLLDPLAAAQWTVQQYNRLAGETDKPVLFKEVGLPTAGDTHLSEGSQAAYYRLLQQSRIRYAYFEAFDQIHKQGPAVERHWGLFRADRSPKTVVRFLPAIQG